MLEVRRTEPGTRKGAGPAEHSGRHHWIIHAEYLSHNHPPIRDDDVNEAIVRVWPHIILGR